MKKFVIVIPSYNNSKWYERNLSSVLSQNYSNYSIVYTDDCSPDGTGKLVKEYLEKHSLTDKVKLILNETRKGAMHNLYDMIHACDDNDIILTVDGDDWLAHPDVLNKLNEVYSNNDIFMTYGSYQGSDGHKGCCRPYERIIIDTSGFRKAQWRASHLRTFYAGLFKKIKKEDFYDPEGKFLDMSWDLGFMIPCLEMSGDRHRFIPEFLYIYNIDNPISDFRVNQKRQGMLDGFIRRKPKYQKIESL